MRGIETAHGASIDSEETPHWRELGDEIDLSNGLTRLSLDEIEYVTLAASVDAGDLSAPRVNRLIEQAVWFEREFSAFAWGKGADVTLDDPSERSHADGRGFEWIDAERVWMERTVDVSEVGVRERRELMEKASELEGEFRKGAMNRAEAQ